LLCFFPGIVEFFEQIVSVNSCVASGIVVKFINYRLYGVIIYLSCFKRRVS